MPGHVVGHAATIRLTPAAVVVSAADIAAELRWEDWVDDLGPGMNGWTVGAFYYARWGPVGISLPVRGTCQDVATPVIGSMGRFLTRLTAVQSDGPRVTLYTGGRDARVDERERHTFRALASALAQRADLRARLGDPARVRRLAAVIGGEALAWPAPAVRPRASTTVVLTAMAELGYVHPFGRPLPGDVLPAKAEAVRQVCEHLGRRPYAQGLQISAEQVGATFEETYFGLDPWPFASLSLD